MSLPLVQYSAKTVANYFLEKARKSGRTINPMAMQKLVYYAHGWKLGLEGKGLIDEQIEAWRYGPVVPSLYHEFKYRGNQPITLPAKEKDPIELSAEDKKLLDRIWEVYGKFSAIQLSNMTHEEGTPWRKVYDDEGGNIPLGTDIPRELMRDHFRGRLTAKSNL